MEPKPNKVEPRELYTPITQFTDNFIMIVFTMYWLWISRPIRPKI